MQIYPQMACEKSASPSLTKVILLKPLLRKAVSALPRKNRTRETPSYVTAAQLARRFPPPALVVDLDAETITRQSRKPSFMSLRSAAA